MKCSRCDYDNPEYANYCNNCGHNLKLDKHSDGGSQKSVVRKPNTDNVQNSKASLNTAGKILVAASVAIMIFMSCILIMVVLKGYGKTNNETASIEYLTSSENTKTKNSSKSAKSKNKSSSSKANSSKSISSDDYDDLTDDNRDDDVYDYPYPDHVIHEY